jgi:hypothetical protein
MYERLNLQDIKAQRQISRWKREVEARKLEIRQLEVDVRVRYNAILEVRNQSENLKESLLRETGLCDEMVSQQAKLVLDSVRMEQNRNTACMKETMVVARVKMAQKVVDEGGGGGPGSSTDMGRIDQKALRAHAVRQLESINLDSRLKKEEANIAHYTEAYEKIKEMTGVDDIGKFAHRYVDQESLINEQKALTLDMAEQLEEKGKLEGELQSELETLGIKKQSSVAILKKIAEESRDELHKAKTESRFALDRHRRMEGILGSIRLGVVDLAERLAVITFPAGTPRVVPVGKRRRIAAPLASFASSAREESDDEDALSMSPPSDKGGGTAGSGCSAEEEDGNEGGKEDGGDGGEGGDGGGESKADSKRAGRSARHQGRRHKVSDGVKRLNTTTMDSLVASVPKRHRSKRLKSKKGGRQRARFQPSQVIPEMSDDGEIRLEDDEINRAINACQLQIHLLMEVMPLDADVIDAATRDKRMNDYESDCHLEEGKRLTYFDLAEALSLSLEDRQAAGEVSNGGGTCRRGDGDGDGDVGGDGGDGGGGRGEEKGEAQKERTRQHHRLSISEGISARVAHEGTVRRLV